MSAANQSLLFPQWILEVDLRKFFDTVGHRQMRLKDVHKVQRVIAKRFARFGLKINTEKTRLVRFGRPSRAGGTGDKPETFDFLGFTHYWGASSGIRPGGPIPEAISHEPEIRS